MDDDRRTELLEGLQAPDATTRTMAARSVRQTDVDDLEVLRVVLGVCADTTPLPAALQPPAPADPFADFFGEAKAKKLKTVGEEATDRLVFTGVIGKSATLGPLVEALEAESPEWLVVGIAKILGETVWQDRLDAVRQLVPALHARDAALYAAIVRFGEIEHRVMVGSALRPYASRAVNELLNHAPSKALMEEALGDGIVSGVLDLEEKDAADALTLLVAWSSPWAFRVAAKLRERFDWALIVLAMSSDRAGEELVPWLESGAPAPLGLVRKVQEVLKASEPLESFPLAAWLAYAGTGVDVVRRWNMAGACREELETFVTTWRDDGEAAERGWNALVALLEAGLHTGVHDVVQVALTRPGEVENWRRDRWEAVAQARPPVPGLIDAVTAALLEHPLHTRTLVPALMTGFPADDLRPLVEAYITLCEARPVVEKPSRPGLLHEEREGVDPVPLQPLAHALADAGLTARLQDVLPYVRAV